MILILEDHPLVQQGIRSLMQVYKSGEEIVCSSSIGEAIDIMKTHTIHTAFVDICLGAENGLDLLAWVKEQKMKTSMFIITSSSRQSDFEKARALGADAYVLKDAFLDEIVYGLKVVEKGGRFYSAALIDKMDVSQKQSSPVSGLTKREKEVFSLLGSGKSNSQISKELYISEGTTKKHISSILSKLNLTNRVEAALLAVEAASGRRNAI